MGVATGGKSSLYAAITLARLVRGVHDPNRGIPRAVQGLTERFEYTFGIAEVVFAKTGRIAAVIMEPMNMIEPKMAFCKASRR